MAAVDDNEVDGGENVRLGFGTLPAGVRHGHQLTVFVIEDNDGFDPIVNITEVDGGDESGSVGFTVTLTDPSDVDISVDWSITDSGASPGVFTVEHGLGGHRDYPVDLPEYAADHGPLTITLQPGDGYRIGEVAAVCVSIADNETQEATPCPVGEESAGPDSSDGNTAVAIGVQAARATEGVDEVIASR